MDITDTEAVNRLGASIYERWGKLDILIANQGILGALMPMHQYDPKTWDEVVAVNLTACQRLIRSVDPLLRQSDAGRAVFVTSGAAVGERPFWGAYAVTKAALEAMVRSYSAESKSTTLKINLLDPGATRTAMRAAAYPGEDPNTLKTPEDLAPLFVDLAALDCMKNGERAGRVGPSASPSS